MSRERPVVRDCACGGVIVAPSADEARPYVQEHGRSLTHALWRFRAGLVEPALGDQHDPRRRPPTADPEAGDLSRAAVSASAGDVAGTIEGD